MYRESWVVASGLCLGSYCAAQTLPADVPAHPIESASLESRIISMIDVVLENHIDPPTRQQMVLRGAKALYEANSRTVPKGLSERISNLSQPDELTQYLASLREEFAKMKDVESVLTSGMLKAVPGDPLLIDADVWKVNEQLAANRYVGTGIVLRTSDDQKLPQIHKTFYNGPAWKAGVKDRDLILEIDGQSTDGKSLSDAVEWLRGEIYTDVIVVVRQPESPESRKLTITRDRTFIPSLEGFRELPEGRWQYAIESAEDIALMRIRTIGSSTLHELRQADAQLRRASIRGAVIDLRVGGGTLHDVVMVADALLDGGTIGHVRSLDSVQTYEARPGALFQDLPLVVLVSEFTPAGYVLLVAALQDHQRAVVIGQPTSDETYVSSVVAIPGRDELIRLATGVMQRADGTTLLGSKSMRSMTAATQGVVDGDSIALKPKLPGYIVPDHIVPRQSSRRRREEAESQPPIRDPVIAKAVEVLQGSAAHVQASGPIADGA